MRPAISDRELEIKIDDWILAVERWINAGRKPTGKELLEMLDTMRYAREAMRARSQGARLNDKPVGYGGPIVDD